MPALFLPQLILYLFFLHPHRSSWVSFSICLLFLALQPLSGSIWMTPTCLPCLLWWSGWTASYQTSKTNRIKRKPAHFIKRRLQRGLRSAAGSETPSFCPWTSTWLEESIWTSEPSPQGSGPQWGSLAGFLLVKWGSTYPQQTLRVMMVGGRTEEARGRGPCALSRGHWKTSGSLCPPLLLRSRESLWALLA